MKNLLLIEQFAKEHFVPIARKKTVEYMLSLIKENNYSSFLEIGTAIGFTSINVALLNKNINVVTIEHDIDRAIIAKKNFLDFELMNQIRLIVDDARFVELEEKFDLIFIDASKKNNEFFLHKFSPLLNENGTIIIDNMNLKDFWGEDANEKKIIKFQKINEEFKKHILSLKEFDTKIYDDIGDGIAILRKAEKNHEHNN